MRLEESKRGRERGGKLRDRKRERERERERERGEREKERHAANERK